MIGYGNRKTNIGITPTAGIDLSFGGVSGNGYSAPYNLGTPVTQAGQVPQLNFSPGVPSVVPQTDLSSIMSFNDPLSNALSNIEGMQGNVIDANTATWGQGVDYSTLDSANQTGGIGNFLKSTFGNGQGGLDMRNLLGIIGSFGSIINARKTYGFMKDSLNFQKESYRTNMANQTKSYNTALEDRARSRYSEDNVAGQARAQDYINRNRL